MNVIPYDLRRPVLMIDSILNEMISLPDDVKIEWEYTIINAGTRSLKHFKWNLRT